MANAKMKTGQKIAIIVSVLGVLVAIIAIVVHVLIQPRTEPDFELSVAPMQGSTQQGTVTPTTIYVQGFGGYKHEVSLSATGEPSGVGVSFSPQSLSASPKFESTMTVNVGVKATPGDYIIIIKGMGADGKEHTCKYGLAITSKPKVIYKEMPEVKLITPKNDEEVPLATTVSGTISGELPDGRYMWVVINPHPSPGEWWPQGGRIEPWTGRWNAPVRLGREEEDKGAQFDIAVILLDEDDDTQYNKYLETAAATGDYPGKPLPRSAVIVQRITVKRK
jgi:hypothetical protein